MFDKNQCLQVELWIQDSLDQRQPANSDPRVLQHVAHCPACDERLGAFLQLSEILELVFDSPTDLMPNECEAASLAQSSFGSNLDSRTDLSNRRNLSCPTSPVLKPQSLLEGVSGGASESVLASSVSESAPSVSSPRIQRRPYRYPQQLSWANLVGTLAASVLAIVAFEGRLPFPTPSASTDRSVIARQDLPSGATAQSPSQSGSFFNIPSVYDVGEWYLGSMLGSNMEPVQVSPARATPASLLTCYELTSELPGVRPLRGSVDMTWGYLQKFMSTSAEPPPQALPKQPDVGQDHRYGNKSLFI